MAHNSADITPLCFGSDRNNDLNASTEQAPPPFQSEFHSYLQTKYTPGSEAKREPLLVAAAAPEPGGDSQSGGAGGANFMNYIGYMTYGGLAAGAFGHDDPLRIQSRAMRFFQEKILRHHAIDNPQVWNAMGDALMTEQHLALQGADFKPVKFKTLERESKHETREEKDERKQLERDGREAESIIKDIAGGLRSPDDYVLAAKFLYTEGIRKADERGAKEAVDHKDEKRLLGRLNLLSGETDRVDAIAANQNSIGPLLDQLGARVSYRLDAAAMLERYGSKVPELGWSAEAARLRQEAQKLYDDPKELSEPVRRRLHQKYPNELPNSL